MIALVLATTVALLGRAFLRERAERVRAHQGYQLVLEEKTRLEMTLAELEEEAIETRRSLQTLIDNLPGVFYRSLNDRQRTLERIEGECQVLTGYEPADLIANRNACYGELIHPSDRERVWREIQTAVAEARSFRCTYRIRDSHGNERWVWEQGRPVGPQGGRVHLEGFITDVSERKRFEDQIQHDTFHDRLTALPNRALFMDRLERSLARWQRHPRDLFAVLCIDLDRFKLINDSLGHVFGDALIVAVAERLAEFLGQEHTVARLGGDEFAILLEEIEHPGEAVRIAERIEEVLRSPVVLEDRELFITGSLGVALSSRRYDRADDLLRDAEIAMYRAKALGGGRHEVFDSAMHQRAVALLHLESDLRRAVHRQEFFLQYQPIVSLDNGEPVGFEALLRWRHPEQGVVLPAKFIAIAEETGLIVPLGRFVLRQASQQMREWQRRSNPFATMSMAVNLSSHQFVRTDLAEEVAEILQETELPGRNLRLELTESVIMEQVELTAGMLTRIKQLEIHLSVDDFGTGYSSLSYLHRFPLDTLKIDRSFVGAMVRDRDNREIVRTIITLAHALGMDVVAEGVETEEQVRSLRELGCELAQGRYFFSPLDAEQIEERFLPTSSSSGWQPVIVRS
jgi:diguanylate cyclase (GGDEF)-like protein/PAS domain S-box-containing protein